MSKKMKHQIGNGGELHPRDVENAAGFTTQQGTPVSDDQNSLHAGESGPLLMDDVHFREKLFHFDHERIPERVVHARGFGAHGYFENYESLQAISCANLFQQAGEKTPVFVRFSTVAGNKGSADLARDVRGFAVKFYTQEGNWDLVGNNIPVFFIQDAMKFPDLIHAAKAEPDRGFPQAQTAHDNFWDFVSLMPESTHMLMWIMSDRAIPRSFRFMEGFGVHTFKLINQKGEVHFVKFHWKPKLGLQSVVWNEAQKINGMDPDFHRRDLWNAIQQHHFPEWELGLQIFDEQFAKNFSFDILDPTKIIPEEEVPIKKVGKLVLNRCVDNFFAETEQVAFCTQNIIPGIGFSDDPLLQGRNFSYLDTQLKRLGSPNFTQLPINAPRCPIHLFQQDGHMALKNPTSRINYSPNSNEENQLMEQPDKSIDDIHSRISGHKTRIRSESFADHYSQARQFYISQTAIEQQHIAEAFIFELSKVKNVTIRQRLISNIRHVDEELSQTIANGLGIKHMPEPSQAAKPTNKNLLPSNALSILKNTPDHFKGRSIGVLLSEGANSKQFLDLQTAIINEGANMTIIAEYGGDITLDDGMTIIVDEKIQGASSVLFDAIVLLVTEKNCPQLVKLPETKDFLMDAFSHCKYIGYNSPASMLFNAVKINNEQDKGCIALADKQSIDGFLSACHNFRYWDRKAT